MPYFSANLRLPYMAAAQSQKHVTHNEALELLDTIAQLAVQAFDATTPPGSALDGEAWALGVGAVNEWAGHDGDLAVWSNGGWLFVTPRIGWRAALGDDLRLQTATGWQPPQLPDLQNIPGVGVNASYDPLNPLSVSGPATLLNHSGAGHQLKLNKATAGDTASVMFQTGWSGRAEFGTTGSDDFAIKVSPDGSSWTTALTLHANSGRVGFGQPGELADGTAAAPALTFASDTDTGLFLAGSNAIGAAHGGVQRWRSSASAFQLDVPLTGSAVQASFTDTTAGRVLTAGAFGLGASGATPEATDLDTLAAPGFYRIEQANAATGHAPASATGWAVLHHQSDAANAVQTAWASGTATLESWHRVKAAGSWQAWVRRSMPSGINANGSFVRLPDGTQICTHTASALLNSDTASGSLYTTATEATWVFPAPFVSAEVLVQCQPQSTDPVWGRGRPTGATTGALRLFSTGVISSAVTCDMIAIGRWY